jgi:hypothetical protein
MPAYRPRLDLSRAAGQSNGSEKLICLNLPFLNQSIEVVEAGLRCKSRLPQSEADLGASLRRNIKLIHGCRLGSRHIWIDRRLFIMNQVSRRTGDSLGGEGIREFLVDEDRIVIQGFGDHALWGTPISVNNPFGFIGLGGGRRSKRMIPWNLLTEMMESITYSVFCRAEFPKSDHAAAWNGRELLS